MTEKEYKQGIEYYSVFPLFKELGINAKDFTQGDEPDLILHNYNGKKIGIEVTSYGGKGRIARNASQKILDEYAEKIDKESDKRFQINIMLKGAALDESLNYYQNKSLIFDEIDGIRSGKLRYHQCRFIDNVSSFEIPNANKSFVSLTTGFIYDSVDSKELVEIIKKKTNKYYRYIGEQKNKELSEYWLVINFPTDEHTDLRTCEINNDLMGNPFQRIYLTDPLYCKRIK